MDASFDSGVVVKLYVPEANSADAIRLVSAYTAPYVLTLWQAVEVKNAIRLKVFRREITPTEMTQSIGAFDQDIADGRWRRSNYAAEAVELKAAELSAGHAATLGCRTLDIIHVAATLVIGVREFVTLDARQAALAKASGLTVKP